MNAYINDTNRLGHRQPPTATLNDSPGQPEEEEERLLPRGGIVSRTPSSATAAVAVAVAATAKSTDCYDDFGCDIEDDNGEAFFTFHPVDEPDVEVVVSNIFSDASALARVGSSSDDDGSSTTTDAPHNDNDLDKSHPTSPASSRSSRRKRSHSELALRAAASGVPTYISDEDEGDDDENNALPGSSHSCDASTSAAQGGASGKAPSLLAEVTVGPLTNAFPSAPETTVDDCEYDDNDDDEDDEEDEEDDDDFEARQRKEEEGMDEEQLRKKRRVEEEERIARNNLWRQSIKRSMFLEPPGAVMNKRATM